MKTLEEKIFQRTLEEKTAYIEKLLTESLPDGITEQKTIAEAMEYSLMAGGKRLRPLIIGESYAIYREPETQKKLLSSFMAAIEMIHTYSLVHDDLPAMDNDDYRRGRKTTHKVYGESMGILTGDALLNFSYETALTAAAQAKNPQNALTALNILARKAGIFGMVGGQVVDVELTGRPVNAAQLDFIYRLKTGALLEASFMMGAALAGAPKAELTCLETVGREVGLAFQIQDDILDVTSTAEELGKPIGSDERNEKTTYVTLYGLEQAQKSVIMHSEQALAALEELSGENIFLNTLILKLIHRKR